MAFLCLYNIIQGAQQKTDLKANNLVPSSTEIISENLEPQFTKPEPKTVRKNKGLQDENKKHILMYHPWGTKSHRVQQHALLVGLLNAGHTVTGVFPENSNIIHDGYTEIVVDSG